MNGQDFNEIQSDAYVTFVGTGSDSKWVQALIFSLLLGLLILACFSLCWARIMAPRPKHDMPMAQVSNDTVIRGGGDSLPKHFIE